MGEPRSKHPDIQLYRGVTTVEGGAQQRQRGPEVDDVEFFISGRVPRQHRATTSRAVPLRERPIDDAYINRMLGRDERGQERRAQAAQAAARRARTPSQWRIAFTRGNRLFEYGPSHQRNRRLSFPPATNRSYYQVGDIVLVGEYSRHHMARVFPELARRDGEGMTLSQMLAQYAGLSESEVRIGEKIITIETTNARTGEGRIVTRPVIFIDDHTAVEFTNRTDRTYNRRSLHFRWHQHLQNNVLSDLIAWSGVLIEVIALPLGGGFRTAGLRLARRVGRSLLSNGMRRFRTHILRSVGQAVRRIVTAFISAFVRAVVAEVQAHLRQNELRQEFTKNEIPINWSHLIANSLSSAVTGTLSAELSHRSSRRLRQWLNTPSEELHADFPSLAEPSPLRVFSHYFAERMSNHLIGLQTTIIDQFGQALADIELDEQHAQEQLRDRFSARMRATLGQRFQGTIRSEFTTILGNFFEGLPLEEAR